MSSMIREKLWTKSFILLLVGNFFMFMAFRMLMPTLPPYMKLIGASGIEIGMITALFSVGAILFRPYIGHLLQYNGRKALVLISAAASLTVTMLYSFTQVVLLVLAFRLLHGVIWGSTTTSISTAAVDVVPNSRLGEGMGFFGLSNAIGMIIAPSVGILVYQQTSFANLIYVAGILCVISIILLVSVRYKTPEGVKNAKKEVRPFSYRSSFIEKNSWYPAFVSLMNTFAYGPIVVFIVIFAEERGIEFIFLFYICNAVMASILRPIGGKWFDRRGSKEIVVVCFMISLVGMWILSYSETTFGIIAAGLLIGIGYGSLSPTLQAWTLSKTPSNRRGIANGMFFSSIDLGIGLSGLVFGVLSEFLEIAVLFRISSVFFAVGLVLTLLEGKNRLKSISDRL